MSVQQAARRTASFGVRLAALIVDAIVLAIPSLIISRFLHGAALNAITWPLTAIYFTVLDGRWGQTIGKRALHIKVVDDVNGQPVGYPRALLRWIVSWVSFIVLLFGYLAMLGNTDGQTWHDTAAHTLVIPTIPAGAS